MQRETLCVLCERGLVYFGEHNKASQCVSSVKKHPACLLENKHKGATERSHRVAPKKKKKKKKKKRKTFSSKMNLSRCEMEAKAFTKFHFPVLCRPTTDSGRTTFEVCCQITRLRPVRGVVCEETWALLLPALQPPAALKGDSTSCARTSNSPQLPCLPPSRAHHSSSSDNHRTCNWVTTNPSPQVSGLFCAGLSGWSRLAFMKHSIILVIVVLVDWTQPSQKVPPTCQMVLMMSSQIQRLDPDKHPCSNPRHKIVSSYRISLAPMPHKCVLFSPIKRCFLFLLNLSLRLWCILMSNVFKEACVVLSLK